MNIHREYIVSPRSPGNNLDGPLVPYELKIDSMGYLYTKMEAF